MRKDRCTKLAFQINRDGSAIVDPNYFWIPRTELTPSADGKVQLINRPAGCATYGTWSNRDDYWTHWAPLPKFRPEDMALPLYPSRESLKNMVLVDATKLTKALESLKTGFPIQKLLAHELEKTVKPL